MVWGAVNPPATNEDDVNYDVDELDPAQLDRFHIVVELPNEPDLVFFKSKFGDFHGKVLVDWWKEQPKEALRILSPRRLEYLGDCHKKGLDIKYLLPTSANAKDLIKKLSVDEQTEIVNRLLHSPNHEAMKKFLSIDTNFLKYKAKIRHERFWEFWKYANPEFISDEIESNVRFADYVIFEIITTKEKVYHDAILEISKKDPNNDTIGVIKRLAEENYTIPKTAPGNGVKLPVLKNANGPDIFNTWSGLRSTINHFAPNDATYFLNTNERRKGLGYLDSCFDTAAHCAPYHLVNFVLSCLGSMQKATITNERNFLNYLASVCALARLKFSEEDIKKVASFLTFNKHKISNNRYAEMIEYLGSSPKMDGILPADFVNKVTEIRESIRKSTPSF
jgi:hypothetical protein